MKKRFNYLVFLLALMLSLGLVACNDNSTKTKDTGDTIKNDLSVAFSGKVVDILGNPMSGVKVQLTSDTKQSTTTDKYGNWLIVVDLGEVVGTPGGGGSEIGGDETLGSSSDQIVRNFPIEITKSRYATYRYEADFSAQIGYTDGTGAVVLLSKTGTVQPTVVMHPYVDNFSFTVYAGANVAPGAVVTLFRTTSTEETDPFTPNVNTGSLPGSRYEVTQKRFVADSNGVITVTVDDKLPADGFYNVFAAPYDMDGDGVYEYDSSITTQPSGGFNLHAHDVFGTVPGAETSGGGTGSLLHYEYDAVEEDFVMTQTEFAPSVLLQDAQGDLVVVYFSIDNVQNIPIAQADNFTVVVMFNRPVTEQTLASIGGPLFTLTGLNGNVVIPYTTTNTGGYLYVITPDQTLTPENNAYTFTIANLLSSSGDFTGGLTQTFSIYDSSATMRTAITPGIDINTNLSYKVDWNDILLGDPSITNPFTPAAMIPNINLSWAVDTSATGYEIWVKDSDTPWQQITPPAFNPVNFTYNDGQFIEATINLAQPLGGVFDAFDPDDTFGLSSIEPFFGGNVVQIVVMPTNINGFSIDPSTVSTIAGLSLSDNWGPQIVIGNGWDGINPTGFTAATRYDDTDVLICVDEPLQDVTLTPEYTSGLYGARASSGYFTVADVDWPDLDLVDPDTDTPYPSNRGYILVDLTPTLTTTLAADAQLGDTVIEAASLTGFAIGDNVNVNSTDEGTITQFNSTSSTFTLSTGLDADAATGSAVYWSGPLQDGYSSVNGLLGPGTNVNDNNLYVNNLLNIAAFDSTVTSPAGDDVTATSSIAGINRITVTTAPTAAYASGTTISGYSINAAAGDITGADAADTDTIANTTLAAPAPAAQPNITVDDGADIANGDSLVLDYAGVRELVTVSDASAAPLIVLAANLANAYVGGESVDERTTFSKIATYGYPMITLPSATGIQPGSTITFDDTTETDSAVVTAAFNSVAGILPNGVVINDILVDSGSARYTFVGGSTFANDSSRVTDALQVNLLDRSSIDSSATDADGDGIADFDQIGYEAVGDPFALF
ncbi:MAG: hypothetical protein SWO11_06380 [Thermodesulfobacteriota bacterium]|nr:hypothetical protein [Thermodesulfobacteriota bacterium]